MVGSRGDGQDGQTRTGAEQLPATLLVLEKYGIMMSCTEAALWASAVEVGELAGGLETWHKSPFVSCDM